MAKLKQSGTMRDVDKMAVNAKSLVELLALKDMPFLVNKVSYLSASTPLNDVLSSLASDLLKTAEKIIEVAGVLSGAEGHIVPEVTSVNNDLRELFKGHYDPGSKSITLFGVTIRKGDQLHRKTPSQISDRVYEAAFSNYGPEFDFEGFRQITRKLRALDKNTIPSLQSPFSERMNYVAVLTMADKWTPFVERLMDTCLDVQNFKMTLGSGQKAEFLERVSSGRAMVDGVVKTSTYISRVDGVLQISSKHKNNPDLLKRINAMLKEIPFIKGIEIDQSIPLVKFHDVLVEIKKMNLDVPDAFELKGRLLGGYGVCGLAAYVNNDGEESYTPSRGFANANLKIVAFDVDHPTSIAHEITHFQDRPILDKVTGMEQNGLRNYIAEYMAGKIDRLAFSSMLDGVAGGAGLSSTLLSDREIIARVGEIGFLLNRHHYQNGESIESFAERVRIAEVKENEDDDEKLAFDIRMVSPIDDYLGTNSLYQKLIYFELDKWSPDELEMVRDYTHDYFYKPNPEVSRRLMERWEKGELSALSSNYVKRRGNNKKGSSVSTLELEKQYAVLAKLEQSSLRAFYEKGNDTGVFQEGELISLLQNALFRLGDKGTGKKPGRQTYPLFTGQISALLDLVEHVEEKRPIDVFLGHRTLVDHARRSFGLLAEALHPSEAHLDLLMKSMAVNTLRSWPDAGKKERPPLNHYQGIALPTRDGFLNSDLYKRYREVLTASYEQVTSFSDSMGSITHLPLDDQYVIAAMHFLAYASKEIKLVSGHLTPGYVESASTHLKAVRFSELGDDELRRYIYSKHDEITSSGFNIRAYMPEMLDHESEIAMEMFQSGLLDTLGITEMEVHDYIDNFDAPESLSRDDTSKRWRWSKNVTPNPIVEERLKWFLVGLSRHPAHQGTRDRRYPSRHIRHPNFYRGIEEDGAMTPLTAFLNLVYTKGENVSDQVVSSALEKVLASQNGLLDAISKNTMAEIDEKKANVFSDGSLANVIGEQSPYSLYLSQTYFNVKTESVKDGVTFSSRFSDAGCDLLRAALVNEFMTAGKKGEQSRTKAVKFNNSSEMVLTTYPHEDGYDAKEQGVSIALSLAKKHAAETPAFSKENVLGYENARQDYENSRVSITRWIQNARVSENVASAVLQGMEAFGNAHFVFPQYEGVNWDALVTPGTSVLLYAVESGLHGGDFRPYINSVSEALLNPDSPEIEPVCVPEITPVMEGEERPVLKKELPTVDPNVNVPPVRKDGVIRKENQLRMF
ncbi:hypothetical protein [Alteromonas sp. 14N.309.X.WAT.G.H12]|uniref:hypothetical protein n=1 Tax=Alteromonas sp. 14N.309.X.WAT.G.H12 TaxID=3120824 RepID=UPI002FD69E43